MRKILYHKNIERQICKITLDLSVKTIVMYFPIFLLWIENLNQPWIVSNMTSEQFINRWINVIVDCGIDTCFNSFSDNTIAVSGWYLIRSKIVFMEIQIMKESKLLYFRLYPKYYLQRDQPVHRRLRLQLKLNSLEKENSMKIGWLTAISHSFSWHVDNHVLSVISNN